MRSVEEEGYNVYSQECVGGGGGGKRGRGSIGWWRVCSGEGVQ